MKSEVKDKEMLHIKMLDYGSEFGFRNEAHPIFSDLNTKFNFKDYKLILLDFSGVATVSSGFAFDLFKQLRTALAEDFLLKIRVRFDQNESSQLVKSIVKGAVLSKPN